MGNATAKPGDPDGGRGQPGAQAAAGMTEAMKKCNSALQYLNTSASVLTTKRNKATDQAKEAFRSGNTQEAVALIRKANIAESDLQTIRRRQLAIERQRSMIEQQQLNTMLTGVLVETSAALHEAQSSAPQDSADAVYQACSQLEEVADRQAELESSHLEFNDIAARTAAAEPPPQQLLHEPGETSDKLGGNSDCAAEVRQLQALIATEPPKPKPKDPQPPQQPPAAAAPILPSVPAENITKATPEAAVAGEKDTRTAAHLI